VKAIVDISLLGTAHYFTRYRNGIARVTEELIAAMMDNHYCDLGFTACNSVEQMVQSSCYLGSDPKLRDLKLYGPKGLFINGIVDLAKLVYPDASGVDRAKLRRRVVSFFLKRMNSLYRGADLQLDGSADIFHSMYYPLPRSISGSGNLKRFITINDMIPVLFPHYFEPEITADFRRVLESIRDDDWIIAISQSTRNDLCDYLKIDPARVFITPLAASGSFYRCDDAMKQAAARRRYGITEGPYILSLSTLEPRKNIDHTIRCFARTVEEQGIQDLQLVLVGSKGWDFDRVFGEIAQNEGIRKRIIVTGYVPDQDLATLYSGSMMFVHPSLYEGFGLPVLEAMQCGVPVITSTTSSLPEVAGDAGILVDPKDADALCQAIWTLYSDAALRGELAAKSLQRASQFSWKKCASDTVAAYRTAMQG
jgi:glycosyltransferase involved in cell wall biosynthesis